MLQWDFWTSSTRNWLALLDYLIKQRSQVKFISCDYIKLKNLATADAIVYIEVILIF
jgi:hypothetical protein